MREGESVHISVIEVNDVPVYFSWTEQPKEYAFIVPANDTCKITLRTAFNVWVLEGVVFPKGEKTLFSLDLDHLQNYRLCELDLGQGTLIRTTKPPMNDFIRTIRVWEMKKNEPSDTEQKHYNPYLSAFVIPYMADSAYLTQDDGTMYPIFHKGMNVRKKEMIAGPISQGYSRFMDGVRYWHEGGGCYEFAAKADYKRDYAVVQNRCLDVRTVDYFKF